MKRILALLLLLSLLLCGCMSHGDVNQVHISPAESQIYTQADIDEAMDTVIRHFRREFEGCTLVHLYYEEDTARNKSCALQYGAEEGIIILSAFEVGPEGSDGSLNPNSTYDRWQWILTRSNGGACDGGGPG